MTVFPIFMAEIFQKMIPLHLPHISGMEKTYVNQVIDSGKLSGNGIFTKKCHELFQKKFNFPKVLLTNSCTDALEMCTLILDLQPDDEILLPSFTFVSTANAFNNFGVKLIFCDSQVGNPNISAQEIESKITSKTKAIVLMHYAGIACSMDEILDIARKHKLYLIEDAALGLGSTFKDKFLGSFGDLATFSFHQTKNITCGEGGLLVINNPELIKKAEIIWEKGTNRAAFLRGESDKYEWESKGSSFLNSEIHASFLLAQLESFNKIQDSLVKKWKYYHQEINISEKITRPEIHQEISINGSIYYLIFDTEQLSHDFSSFMFSSGIVVSSHYRCLHSSNYFKNRFSGDKLINCEKIARTLIRLPLYTDLSFENQRYIVDKTNEFIDRI